MSEKWNTLPLRIDEAIEFPLFSEGGGRIEFEMCVNWKRGKFDVVTLVPISKDFLPRNAELICELPFKLRHIIFSTVGVRGEARVWRQTWCPRHKGMSQGIYPPDGVSFLSLGISFGDTLWVQFSPEFHEGGLKTRWQPAVIGGS